MNLDRDALELTDRTTLWHAFSQMADYHGPIIQSGLGCYLTDIDGRTILDGVSSMWCNVHGHSHPYINNAMVQQLQKVAHVSLLGLSHPVIITLAKRLCEIAPAGLEHVFFASDGASAIEVAMKMAFQYWRQKKSGSEERNLFLSVGGAYHGDTIGAVSVGGVSRFRAMFHPLLFPTVQGRSPVCNSFDRNDPQLVESTLAQYEKLLQQHAGQIVAIIVEPLVQAAAGIVFHPQGFLRGLRQLADRYGTLLIADEIAVGFGRTGSMFACEQEDVQPDILCLGKALSAGYLPLSAAMTTPAIFEAFLGEYAESKSLFHGHTFGGNPVACAAALASLELFQQEKTLDNVALRGLQLKHHLEQLGKNHHVFAPRSLGLIGAFELVPNHDEARMYPWTERRGARLCDAALRRGVWLRPLGNTVVIMPPLCISADELNQLIDAIEASIDEAVSD